MSNIDIVYSQDTIHDSIALKSSIEQQIIYNAEDSIIYDLQNNKIYLYGKSFVKYGDIELNSYKIIYDISKNLVNASPLYDSVGNKYDIPHFKDGADEFWAEKVEYNLNTKKGLVVNSKTKQQEGYIHGNKVKSFENKEYHVKEAKYTTCELDDPHFYFKIDKAIIKPNDKIITGPLMLYISDIPTPIALPFGFFPNSNKRSSGFLLPSYDVSDKYGLGITNLGYYQPFNDNLAFTSYFSIYTNGSWQVNLKTDIMNRYKYKGKIFFEYQNYLIENSKLIVEKQKSWKIEANYNQNKSINPYLDLSANVNFINNRNHNKNSLYITDKLILDNTYTSNININKKFINSPIIINSRLGTSQNSKSGSINLILPQISANITKIKPFKNSNNDIIKDLYFSINSDFYNSISTYDTILNSNYFIDELRKKSKFGLRNTTSFSKSIKLLKNKINTNISINASNVIFFRGLTQNIKYNANNYPYFEDSIIYNRFKSAYNYGASINITTSMYGFYSFSGFLRKNKDFILRHKIDPNISASISNGSRIYTNQVVVNDSVVHKTYLPYYGYYNFDNYLDYKSKPKLNFSLRNNFEAKYKKDSTEHKKITFIDNLNIFSSYDFNADSFQLSIVSIRMSSNILNLLNVNIDSRFDPYYNYQGLRKDILYISKGKLAKFLDLGINFSTKITNKTFDKSAVKENFNANIGYSFNYSNNSIFINRIWVKDTLKIENHTINFTGNYELTENWLIDYNLNFDLKRKNVSYSSFTITRKLHCWSMRLYIIPIGIYKNYTFTISANSDLLRDLKYQKRNSWRDN